MQTIFAADVEPSVESTHLAALMQVVNLTDKGNLAVRPASKVTGPDRQASGLPKTRRRFMLESLLATLAGKIAAGGFAVALAAVPVAATGNMPDQMQTGISRAVENIGIHIPVGDTAEEALKKAEDAIQTAEDAAEGAIQAAEGATEVVTDVVEDGVDGEANQPNENAAFGQGVAADAKDGGVDGQEISEAARVQAEERKAAGQAHRPEGSGQPTTAGTPEDAGSQSQTGLDTAGDTPAGGNVPGSVPGGKPAGVGRP